MIHTIESSLGFYFLLRYNNVASSEKRVGNLCSNSTVSVVHWDKSIEK